MDTITLPQAKPLSQTQSTDAFQTALSLMPGGVNSPVRAFKAVGGQPVFIDRAKGAFIWDIDGNAYIDYVGSWGPAILGHTHPNVIQRIQQVAEKGTSFGAPTLLENALAEKVIALVPGIEKVRFVNSGTEAVMSCVRLARAVTGREKIIKFAGCYHGHADALLVKAGSGATTLGLPDSPGVNAATAASTLTATYNCLQSVQTLFEQHPQDIAAILIEPVAGNMGCVPPEPGFLEGLRSLCTQFGALLVFDEVMTGFRVALGGAQQRYKVQPDITALGKIIGGGLPVGAYGASNTIMAMVAPEGPMYQAGTLSGNPLAMAAGLETLTLLETPGVYDQLEETSVALANGLRQAFQAAGVPVCIQQVGAMLTVFFQEGPVRNYEDATQSNTQQFKRFHQAMLQQGVYLPPSQYEAWFVSLAHDKQTNEQTIAAVVAATASLKAIGG